jgi:hypothetical protein
MNLRIADSAGLVAFLHGVISNSGETLLVAGDTHVVEVNGVLFYHGEAPVTVGGPFTSLEALVRSEGVRRYAEMAPSPGVEPAYEVFEWMGSFLRLDENGVEQYRELEEAKNRMSDGLLHSVSQPGE